MTQLHHLHFPGLISYHHAGYLQSLLVNRLLAHKKLLSSFSTSPSQSLPPRAPPPTILTFTPHPIYTTGRREQHTTLSPSQINLLTQPLSSPSTPPQKAEITTSLRGGQITFHGPGQIVAYPILSLSNPASFSAPIRPRCYVDLLEQVTINTLARYGIRGSRTENPGVWFDGLLSNSHDDRSVIEKSSRTCSTGVKEEEKKDLDLKIAALGVHLRRFTTSHGVALNVSTDLRWFERIVACGLEGKGVTSMRAVGVDVSVPPYSPPHPSEPGGSHITSSSGDGNRDSSLNDVDIVARAWVEEFAQAVGGIEKGEIVDITEGDVLALALEHGESGGESRDE